MRIPRNQPFWTSVTLHVVVLFGLFLATLVEALKPKEPPHVFEMVAPPAEEAMPPSEAEARPEPMPESALPDLPPVPDLVRPQPRTPPDPAPAEPSPQPPRLISRAEFIEQFGEPQPRQPTARSNPRPTVTAPQIDVPKLVVPANPTASRPRPEALTAQQRSALGDYSTQLRARIDAAWGKPERLTGRQLAATVVFNVSSSGRISNVRLNPRSGNSDFDQSVLRAFRRARSAGPTPTGQDHVFTMTFRMAAD